MGKKVTRVKVHDVTAKALKRIQSVINVPMNQVVQELIVAWIEKKAREQGILPKSKEET